MAAGSEALVLKISADTTAVAAGLEPMTSALDGLKATAAKTGEQLGALADTSVTPSVDTSDVDTLSKSVDDTSASLAKLDDVKVAPAADASNVDNLAATIDDAKGAADDLSRSPITIQMRREALDKAKQDIEALKDQIAEEVQMGVSTRDSEKDLAALQRSVDTLTEDDYVIDVQLEDTDTSFALENLGKLRKNARAVTDAFISLQSDGLATLPGAISTANTSMILLNNSMNSYIEKRAAANLTTGGFAAGLGKVSGFLAGPWGLAVGAGITLLSQFVSKSKDASEESAKWADALDRQAGALSRANREKVATQLNDKGLLDLAEKLHVSTADITAGLLGNGDAMNRVNVALKALSTTDVRHVFGETADVAFESNKDMVKLREGIAAVGEEMGTSAEDARRLAIAVNATSDPLATMAEDGTHNAAVWKEFGKQVDESRRGLDAIVSSIDILNGRFATVREATGNYEAAVDAATAAIKENGKAVTAHGKAFDTNKEKGRANEKALTDMAKAASDLAHARLADADASGESSAKILADYEKQRASLLKMAERMGLNKTAAEKYVDALLQTPEEIATEVELTGYGKAESQMKDLTKDRNAVVNVTLNVDKFLESVRRGINAARAELPGGALSANPSSAAPAPAPSPGLTLLQPRLYLDGRPIRAALRNDVTSTVATQLAHTRTRGRL